MIIANDITRDGAGFDAETNAITLIARDTAAQPVVEVPLVSKLEAAHRIMDAIAKLRRNPKETIAAQQIDNALCG